jgi:hypothetical protein
MSHYEESKFQRSESESENKIAYNNHLRTLNYCNNIGVDEALKILSEMLDVNEISFYKLCLGEFYYSKFLLKAKKTSKELIKKVTETINKNELDKDDKELLEFWREKLITTIQISDEFFKTKTIEKKLENPFPSIFSTGLAYQLFLKLHDSYKHKKVNYTANYSFVFYALESDGFLVCNQTGYIDFLNDEYEILLDRIDKRQSKSEKKMMLYNSYKNNA